MHRDAFELRLGRMLEQTAAAPSPDYLALVLNRTATTRQRPAWTFPGRWLPVQLTISRPTFVTPRLAWLIVLALLALAIALAAIGWVGAHRVPPPFGLATTGMLSFDASGDIYVANGDGSNRHAITAGSAWDWGPAWSPDGRRVAYFSRASQDAATMSLVVVDGEGRNPIVLDTNIVKADYPFVSWAPDSLQVVYVADVLPTAGSVVQDIGRLYVADLATRTRRPITPESMIASDPAWGPDGRTIAFKSLADDVATSHLNLVNADGTNLRQTAAPDGDFAAYGLSQWSPDGRWFVAYGKTYPHEIYVVSADGSTVRNVTNTDAADDFWPTWSNDGKRVAYETGRPGSAMADVHVVNADGSNDRTLQVDDVTGGTLYWSPDDKLLFGSDAELKNIVVITVDGSRAPYTIPADGNSMTGNWQRLP